MREAGKDDDKSTLSARRSKPGTPSKPSTPSKVRPKQATVEDSTSSIARGCKPAISDISSLPKSETTNTSTTDSGATERPVALHADRNSSPPQIPTLHPEHRPSLSHNFHLVGKPHHFLHWASMSTRVRSPSHHYHRRLHHSLKCLCRKWTT